MSQRPKELFTKPNISVTRVPKAETGAEEYLKKCLGNSPHLVTHTSLQIQEAEWNPNRINQKKSLPETKGKPQKKLEKRHVACRGDSEDGGFLV